MRAGDPDNRGFPGHEQTQKFLILFVLNISPLANHEQTSFRRFSNTEVSQVVVLKISPLKNHEKTTFRASLKPQGPRDRACGKERGILCRIALTRPLHDQMAPQLCNFYVPRKLRSFSSFVLLKISPLEKKPCNVI